MSGPLRRFAGAARPANALGGLVLSLAVASLAAGCASSGHAATRSSPAAGRVSHDDQTYGSLPSWLPTAAPDVGRVVTTSETHPRLGIQGDTMRVVLPTARLLVTAVGPAVPEEGHFPIPASTRCEFTVTMTGADHTVPIIASQWTAVDERNVLHELRPVGSMIPRSVTPAAGPVSFELVADLPPGSGALIWSPDHGRTVATWDFDVEID